ncbi:MAG: UDP-N-acetylmuramoyl-tripeptide--D-alanyl-D-alanine ligase, partial [Firmicutes bacterium]|nr:UDP-N-acetylmuramoyl-tripeptide--D-alanyl-D-alanine ligase [Bacillota bacterium]
PLTGEHFDGHDYIPDAVALDAAAVLVQESQAKQVVTALNARNIRAETAIISVTHTLRALQDLAREYRNLFDVPLIAVTGSTGKTTTKDMIASILKEMGSVNKSPENFNNEIGLPLALLQFDEMHNYGVVEMGMRGLGQIEELTKIAKPQVGVITNVDVVHIELLGSLSNIAAAKEELLINMPLEGVVVLNADDDLVRQMGADCEKMNIVYYGYQQPKPACPSTAKYVTAQNIAQKGEAGISFKLCCEGQIVDIKVPLPGLYQVHNALAAAAACMAVGAGLEHVQAGLANVELSGMRMEQIQLACGGLLINDAYNANPTAMEAALETTEIVAAGRAFGFILGDMLELGHLSKQAHYDIGQKAAAFLPNYLITVGENAKEIARGARDQGMDKDSIIECSDYKTAQNAACSRVRPGEVVLVKGSRGMALEHVVWALRQQVDDAGGRWD